MILGLSPALFVAAFAAIVNVGVIVFGVQLTTEGIAALNVAFGALIALVAGTPLTDHAALADAAAARKAG